MYKSDPVVLGLSAHEPSAGTSLLWRGSVKSDKGARSHVDQVVHRWHQGAAPTHLEFRIGWTMVDEY